MRPLSISVMVGENTVEFSGGKPVAENGRILVPARVVFEEMGAVVTWDGASKRVIVEKEDVSIIVQIGNNVMTVNGKEIILEYILKTILITSIIGTVSMLFFALAKPITKKHFLSGWHYYIWMVVLITMIIPFRFVVTEDASFAPMMNVQETVNIQQDNYIVQAPEEKLAEEMIEREIVKNAAKLSQIDIVKKFAESKIKILSMKILSADCLQCGLLKH